MCRTIKQDIYDHLYDYDDLKIAVCVSDYLTNETDKEYTFEDIAQATLRIRKSWECDRINNELSQEELAYIQSYAYRFMKTHFGG